MASINVNSSVDDMFYRYKMPRIAAKHEGKGNGVKTVLVNVPEIAKAIGRPATYVTKFFGCELGAQTQFDSKNDRYIVNGMHDAEKLQDLLYAFIRKFVLCQYCENPETELEVTTKKSPSITQVCKACGFNSPLSLSHKIVSFIIRNPPSSVHISMSKNPVSRCKEDKHKKRSELKSSKEAKQQSFSYPDILNRTSLEESHIRSTKSETAKAAEENEVWITDVSEDGVLARLQELSSHARSFASTNSLDSTFDNRFEKFCRILLATISGNGPLNNQTCRKLLLEAKRLSVVQKAPLAFVELLLSEDIIPAIFKYKNLLIFFTYNKRGAQKHFLRGIEQLAVRNPAAVTKKIARILKVCYDNDILDESVILEWAAKEPVETSVPEIVGKEVRKGAEPFIRWLQEAEEESDDSQASSCQTGEASKRKSVDDVALPKEQDDEDSEEIDIESI